MHCKKDLNKLLKIKESWCYFQNLFHLLNKKMVVTSGIGNFFALEIGITILYHVN